jgi:hypothetical protein
MKHIVFSGCSWTSGIGWLDIDEKESANISVPDHPSLYVNLCHSRIEKFSSLKLINNSVGGWSNTDIFEDVVQSISQHGDQIDTIFCQWTSMPRYNFNTGLELWTTAEGLNDGTHHHSHDINLSDGTHWPRKYVRDLLYRLKVMHHLHWEIVKVVKYANIIVNLAKKVGINNVFFINGICPWDKNYFVELTNCLPDSYTNFTKTTILNIINRNDEDIFKLYKQIHSQYRSAGGIDESSWINLYDPLMNHRVDRNFDGAHPGTKSNEIFFQIIHSRLKHLNII